MNNAWSRMAKLVALLAVLVLLLAGCLKTKDLPVEPSIAIKSVEQVTDTLILTISFTDGDGDIGLAEDQVEPPFNVGSYYYNNLFYDPEWLVNGVWTTLDQPAYYRVKVITPEGQNKALDGEIAITLAASFFPLPPVVTGDTIRFKVKLVDRALHESNVVTTASIIVQ